MHGHLKRALAEYFPSYLKLRSHRHSQSNFLEILECMVISREALAEHLPGKSFSNLKQEEQR